MWHLYREEKDQKSITPDVPEMKLKSKSDDFESLRLQAKKLAMEAGCQEIVWVYDADTRNHYSLKINDQVEYVIRKWE